MSLATAPVYRRDRVTWVVFAALVSFGVINAGLGPALPYLRAAEHASYVEGVLHQVAFAIGGGVAGVLAARVGPEHDRALVIRLGLGGAALTWVVLGYGGALAVTVVAAFFVSLLATSALVRLWATLADEHGAQRTVAMTEGEVMVSLGGILAPLLIAALADSRAGWRSAFVAGAAIMLAAVLASGRARLPAAQPREPSAASPVASWRGPTPTLVVVFAIVALEFILAFWVASYLTDDLGVDPRMAAATVSGLYAANLAGRVVTSRLARRHSDERLLAAALVLALAGLPILLAATSLAAAALGLVLAGIGIGAMFPLASAMHVVASGRGPDSAIGQVFAAAAIGQIFGPLIAGLVAEAWGLRAGLVAAPALALLAAAALRRHAQRAATASPISSSHSAMNRG